MAALLSVDSCKKGQSSLTILEGTVLTFWELFGVFTHYFFSLAVLGLEQRELLLGQHCMNT